MKKYGVFILFLIAIACSPKLSVNPADEGKTAVDFTRLRKWYSRPAYEWPAPMLDKSVQYTELGKLPTMPYPADNPYSQAKAALGKQLFFDPRMSVSNQIACATCHDPELGWGDGRKNSFGHDRQRGKRNAPTLLNAGHWEILFWDGRAASLEEQIAFPVQDHLEMNQDIPGLTWWPKLLQPLSAAL